MLTATTYNSRPYTLQVTGSGQSYRSRQLAAIAYVEAIEFTLGSICAVVECLNAWEKELVRGLLELNRTEINHAAAWRTAHYNAYRKAAAYLIPGQVEITITLK